MDRYKARLVAKGFAQRKGSDYDETFSPVVRGESVRMILALAAQENLHMHQMDVETAFLHGKKCICNSRTVTSPRGMKSRYADYTAVYTVSGSHRGVGTMYWIDI